MGAGVVLVETSSNGDGVIQQARSFFEEHGNWTTVVSEQDLVELRALSALDQLAFAGDSVPTVDRALKLFSEPRAERGRAILVSVIDEAAPELDFAPLRSTTERELSTDRAGIDPLGIAFQRLVERLVALDRRAEAGALALARRDAQVADLAAKLADLAGVADEERRTRRRVERELEEAKSTRGYRLGLAVYRTRRRSRSALRAAYSTLTSPLRRLRHKLAARRAR